MSKQQFPSTSVSKGDVIVGIDPGINGGVAVMEIISRQVWFTACTSVKGVAIHDLDLPKVLAHLEGKNIRAIGIENPPLFIGGRPQPASRLGKLRESYGFWRGHFSSYGLLTHRLTPADWQSMYAIPHEGDHKRLLAVAAINLYPSLEDLPAGKLLSVCDAILICNFIKVQLYGSDTHESGNA